MQSFLNKFLEFFLFVVSACVIIYYLNRNIYGTPAQMKESINNTKIVSEKLDTIYALHDLNSKWVMDVRNKQNEIIDLVNNTNQMIIENNKEISSLKKVVNQKINTINKQVHQQNFIDTSIQQKDYSAIDSFFKSRHNKNK